MKVIIDRLLSLIYYSLNFYMYGYYDFRAVVRSSVRVAGKKYIKIGKNSVVQRFGWLLALKIDDTDPVLEIGENCAIGDFCHIAAVRKVVIEDDVLVANNVYISDNLHQFERIDLPIIRQDVVFKSQVVLGSGCWIGENVSIIGASVGKNSVVGANSVVTKDIPDFSVAVGSPAKVIKKYDFGAQQWVSQT